MILIWPVLFTHSWGWELGRIHIKWPCKLTSGAPTCFDLYVSCSWKREYEAGLHTTHYTTALDTSHRPVLIRDTTPPFIHSSKCIFKTQSTPRLYIGNTVYIYTYQITELDDILWIIVVDKWVCPVVWPDVHVDKKKLRTRVLWCNLTPHRWRWHITSLQCCQEWGYCRHQAFRSPVSDHWCPSTTPGAGTHGSGETLPASGVWHPYPTSLSL